MKYSVNYSPSIKAISGWVSRIDEGKSVSDVTVLLKGLIGGIKEVKCDIYREDVKLAGVHDTGVCGFRFSQIEHSLIEGNFYKVEIVVDGQSTVVPLMYGDHNSVKRYFTMFEVPRDDLDIMMSHPILMFKDGCDLLNLKKLMIRLRRGKRSKGWRGRFTGIDYTYQSLDWELFRLLVISNLEILIKYLDARYLWSVVDTFVDYGSSVEKLAGLSISNWMYQERFSQTLNNIYNLYEKASPVLDSQYLYWGGMRSNLLRADDAMDVFITKNLECLTEVPYLKSIFIELMNRAAIEDGSTIGINFKHSPYFREMWMFYKTYFKKHSLKKEDLLLVELNLNKLFNTTLEFSSCVSVPPPLLKRVIGPSHLVRLRDGIEHNLLPLILGEVRLVGVGSMPIWSPRVFKELKNSSSDEANFYIVSDFRFGNKLLRDESFTPNLLPAVELGGVEKDLISTQNDKSMYDLCIHALDEIVQLPGDHKLLFWDLSIREYENRANRKYFINGAYSHPVWNLSEVLNKYSNYAIDTNEILKYGNRLYIDSSAHPSFVGWATIYMYLTCSNDHFSIASIIKRFDSALSLCVSNLVGGARVIITGESVFTNNLTKLVSHGVFSLPAGWKIVPISYALEASEEFSCCLFFPSIVTYNLGIPEINCQTLEVKRIQNLLKMKYDNLHTLFYDNWAFESISKRHDFLGKFSPTSLEGKTTRLESEVCSQGQIFRITTIEDFEPIIELNVTLIPTLKGVLEIIGRSVGGKDRAFIHCEYEKLKHQVFNFSEYLG